MKPAGLPTIRFQGNFKKKKRANPWRVLGAVGGCATGIGLIYLLFFSDVLAIRAVEISGFDRTDATQVEAVVWAIVNERTLRMQPYRDIIFFNTERAAANITKLFPSLRNVSVEKNYWHTLNIRAQDRTPVGIWCAGATCRYYDQEGSEWGSALQSSGSLLTVIEDQREKSVDREFLSITEQITQILPELNIAIKKIIIPSDVPAEFYVQTARGYIVKFALDEPIEQQLQTLRIFLEQKRTDQNFVPQDYIDLRIPGRVYHK